MVIKLNVSSTKESNTNSPRKQSAGNSLLKHLHKTLTNTLKGLIEV